MKTVLYEEKIDLKPIITHCHIFESHDSKFSYCGVPRLEQPKHGSGNGNTEFCIACGMVRCPKCRSMSRFK